MKIHSLKIFKKCYNETGLFDNVSSLIEPVDYKKENNVNFAQWTKRSEWKGG